MGRWIEHSPALEALRVWGEDAGWEGVISMWDGDLHRGSSRAEGGATATIWGRPGSEAGAAQGVMGEPGGTLGGSSSVSSFFTALLFLHFYVFCELASCHL